MRLPRTFCVVSWFVAACATSQPPADSMPALQARAASDLSCPQSLLRITPLGDQTFAETRQPLYLDVEGCSMHVVYMATKNGYVMSQGYHRAPAMAPDHVDVR
jgi:hypothetical protein